MALNIGNLLQGSQPKVPGVKQAGGISVLQGSNQPVQGSTLNVQGSSPVLQGSSPILQPAVSPQLLNPNTKIIVPPKAPVVPEPVVQPVAASAPVATSAAAELPDRSNSINTNLAALEGADLQRTSGLGAIQDTLGKLFGRYGEEASANEATYGGQSDANKGNFLRNMQAALSNAVQGRRGLFGILSSLGALSGSGINLANRAVQTGANADISGANDTFGENRSELDTNIANFRTADERRRQDAEAAAEASRLNLENSVLQNKQKIFGNLADDYSAMGNAAKAKEYADMIAALFPEIARTSVPAATVNYAPASFAPIALSKYVGGSGGTQVVTAPAAPNSTLPGLLALSPQRRRDE